MLLCTPEIRKTLVTKLSIVAQPDTYIAEISISTAPNTLQSLILYNYTMHGHDELKPLMTR